jgi:hypothetical protein
MEKNYGIKCKSGLCGIKRVVSKYQIVTEPKNPKNIGKVTLVKENPKYKGVTLVQPKKHSKTN